MNLYICFSEGGAILLPAMQEEASVIKRKVKSGAIDVHPTEKALIVNYEVEAVILGENGQPMISDKKECQKLIRLKNLNSQTDCAMLAKEVVNKCKLIHPSKLADVEHLIYYLQNRKRNAFNSGDEKNEEKVNGTTNSTTDALQSPDGGEKAYFTNLEDYVELLYEEIADKTKGSALILYLAKDHVNLDELSKNESLLSALARVLREDWKKSLDLSTNIVYVFYYFSTFTTFHKIISQYKIGLLCMEIIHHELKRYYDIKNEMDQTDDLPVVTSKIARSRLPIPRNAKSAINQKPKSQIPVMNFRRCSLSADETRKISNAPPRSISAVRENLSVNGIQNTMESEKLELKNKKFDLLVKKQNRLLRVCFDLLLNIAEHEEIEDKMRKRNIVSLLIQALDRNAVDLLVVLLSFLKKLSLYRENKDQMMNLDLIEKLPKLLMRKDANVDRVLLALMYNLSFDLKLRERIIKNGFLPELVKLLASCKDETILRYVLGILYHLTMDDRVKSMFAYTDCMPMISEMLLQSDSKDTLILAICLNLALNNRCAEEIANDGRIHTLMKRTFQKEDVILMKIARNISVHADTKHYFVPYAHSLVECIKSCKNSNFLLECIGLLANLSTADIDFCNLFQNYDIIPFIKNCLTSSVVEDDVVLEVVILIGTAIYDENCAELFYQYDILVLLTDLLKAKQEDDELVLQIIYIFYQALQHPLTRDYLIKNTDAAAYFIDLMHDDSSSIRKMCHMCLEITREIDESSTDKIKMEKFQWHNSHWLEMIQNQILDKASSIYLDNTDDAMPRYNLLQQSMIFQSGSHMSLNVDGNVEVVNSMLQSTDSSRSLSRYDSEVDDFDLEVLAKNKLYLDKQDPIKDALKNLIISDDMDSLENSYSA